MPYRSAILAAIEDLKDYQTGSPISSIKRHIQTHKNHIDPVDDDDDPTWNETLFQSTVKSLLEQGEIVHVSGSNYKLSEKCLKKRTELLRARAEAELEQKSSHNRHHHSCNISAGVAAAESGEGCHNQCHYHLGEEPPKESPKKKTLHAKVKIGDSKIITVLNPNGGKHGKKHDEEDMDTENEGDAIEVEGIEHKKHVKIIPRKVDGKKENDFSTMTAWQFRMAAI